MFEQFSNLIERYDTFILDIWGVIHDGFQAYPGTVQCVEDLIKIKKNIYFLSNAPRPGSLLMQKLNDLGIPKDNTEILSSGDAVRAELQNSSSVLFKIAHNSRGYHLGAARNQDILAGIDLALTEDIEQAGFILLTVFLEEGENLNQFDSLLAEGLRYQLPLICANPDKEVIHGNTVRYCAGFFAEKYEKMGGIVHYYGKPYPTVYKMIFQKLSQKSSFNKQRILMVGDTLETDILGAKGAGIPSALTKTGNVAVYLGKQQAKGLTEDENVLQALFAKEKLSPDWVIPGLWF